MLDVAWWSTVPLLLLLYSWEQHKHGQLARDYDQLVNRSEETARRLRRYEALEPRSPNPSWQRELEAAKQARLSHETSQPFVDALFDTRSRRFPHGHDTAAWEAHLRRSTPSAFEEADAADADAAAGPRTCSELSNVVVSAAELAESPLSAAARSRARSALTECGFVYLDDFYPAARIHALRRAYEGFRDTDEARLFEYPCQGEGRVEHMLPFAPPCNDSSLYADPRLLTLLGDFLGPDGFKLELMTVITSPPGSGDQRWHQGWRYLFHPDERLPPFAVVAALPLDDVTPAMGPTEMCPGKKRRFYYGWRCEGFALPRIGTTAGTLVLFDYKLLHRGLGNADPHGRERPMVSMVFSRHFFVNAEAFVNRGISLTATLHLRRWWEEWFWHPESRDEMYAV